MTTRLKSLTCVGLILVLWLLAACAPVPGAAPTTGESGEGAAVRELHVLNWQGYGSDEPWAIEQFEQAHNARVIHDYFNSEDELLTKLRTSPGKYDVVLPNIAYIPPAIQDGLLQPIDVSRLAVWSKLPERFQTLPEIVHEGEVYGVPWAWGATSLVYNTELYPEGFDSLNVLWDPAYAGQVGFEDNYEDAVIFAALALGLENPSQPEDLDAVRAKLEALMPNVRAFWQSEDEFNRLFSSGEISLGVYWSGSTSRAQTVFGLPIAFVIPQEGAIGWIDAWSIPADAPNPELAYAWIDFMSSPEFYVEWDRVAGAPVPANPESLAQMPEDSFTNTVFGDPSVVEKLAFITYTPPEVREQWIELWQEVKAGAK
ncbi:MAG: spermidine/putrescine ABC transporter substrate-binding protein [Litorilinea sp.]|nr:MAG: spermidine/putrescine ABC transporter substrate-binding protein [Litorilinea sp.]